MAGRRSGVSCSFITTSPTKVEGATRSTSIGKGSPAFTPSGVALATMSYPPGSTDPVEIANVG